MEIIGVSVVSVRSLGCYQDHSNQGNTKAPHHHLAQGGDQLPQVGGSVVHLQGDVNTLAAFCQ